LNSAEDKGVSILIASIGNGINEWASGVNNCHRGVFALRLFPMLAAFLTTVFFSVSIIFGTRSSKLLGGMTANFWRLVVATALLGVWAHTCGAGFHGDALPLFIVSGCVGFGIGDMALFQAMPRIGSRLSALLVQCLAAPFGALIEWLWLGTVLSGLQLGCAAVILAGVVMALKPHLPVSQPHRQVVVGVWYGVVAALGQALGAVISRKAFAVALASGQSIDGASAAYQRIIGGIVVGALGLIWLRYGTVREGIQKASPPWKKAAPWVVLNGLAGPVLGVSCFQWALKSVPSGVVLPIVATTPLVVIPLARILEGDRATAIEYAGGAIAVLGAVALAMATH
jgi:drug/metabolite transporter (DMT)-like permease